MHVDVFVKTGSHAVALRGDAGATSGRLTHEAAMAAFAGRVRRSDGHAIAPPVLGASATAITFRRVPGRPLTDVLAGADPGSCERAVAGLGRATAALHACPVDGLPGAAPTVLSPDDLEPRDLALLGAATLEVYREVQDDDAAVALIRRARDDRHPDGVVHNDLRAGNVLVPGSDPGDVRLVDWEFAGAGSRARDLGTVLADLSVFALQAGLLRRRDGGTAPAGPDLAGGFLRAYRAEGGVPPAAADVSAHLAAALFQSCVARTHRELRRFLLDTATLALVKRVAAAPAHLWERLGDRPAPAGGAR